MCLLAWHERGLAITARALALQWYVEHLNASVEPIAFVDTLPFQVGIWALLYADDDDGVVPDRPVVEAIRAQLDNAEHLHLVNCTGYSTFPGDLDTTASAVIGLRLTVSQRRGVLEAIEPFFDHDHYKTFLYEHTLSTTTNIHVAAAWPENPRIDTVLDWLASQRDSDGFISCKWHASPFYPITELARLFASSPHQKARKLARDAGQLLLATQRRDGGWGFEKTTCEETSYAVLALTRLATHGGMDAARLRTVFDHARPILEASYPRHDPLWVCKTLYSMPPVTRVLQRLALQRLRRFDSVPIQELGKKVRYGKQE